MQKLLEKKVKHKKLKSEYVCSYLGTAQTHKRQQHRMMTQETAKLPLLTSWVCVCASLALSLRARPCDFSASADRVGKWDAAYQCNPSCRLCMCAAVQLRAAVSSIYKESPRESRCSLQWKNHSKSRWGQWWRHRGVKPKLIARNDSVWEQNHSKTLQILPNISDDHNREKISDVCTERCALHFSFSGKSQ